MCNKSYSDNTNMMMETKLLPLILFYRFCSQLKILDDIFNILSPIRDACGNYTSISNVVI